MTSHTIRCADALLPKVSHHAPHANLLNQSAEFWHTTPPKSYFILPPSVTAVADFHAPQFDACDDQDHGGDHQQAWD